MAADTDGDGTQDPQDVFPCDGGANGIVYAPGAGQHATLLFEDEWPMAGDQDFNDLAMTYNYRFEVDAQGRVIRMRATYNLKALGGTYPIGLGLVLPVSRSMVQSVTRTQGGQTQNLAPSIADAQFTVAISANLREFFPGQSGPINVYPNQNPALTAAPIVVDVVFSSAQVLATTEAPFDIYIFRSLDLSHEIHRTAYMGTAAMRVSLFNTGDDASTSGQNYVDYQGLPFALTLPAEIRHPLEMQHIAMPYPGIVNFAASAGTQSQDYYQTNTRLGQGFDYEWSPVSVSVAPPAVDLSCYSCADGISNGFETGIDCGGPDCGSCYSYAWTAGTWNTCSVTCGGGIQSRNYTCQRSDGLQVADANCSGSRPSSTQSCSTHKCPDPYQQGVVLLLHFDERNGSTTTYDVKGHTIYTHGDARISSSRRRFGGGAAYFDGHLDWFQTEDHVDLHFGGGAPYTIELWADGFGTIVNDDWYGHFLNRAPNGDVRLLINGVTGWVSPWPVIDTVADGWHHYSIAFDGRYYRVFVDGILRYENTGSFSQTNDRLTFGCRNGVASHSFTGYIDEVRVTQGIARYTGNSSVPTSAFSGFSTA